MKKKYDDIINLPHHLSDHHPRMSISDRAGQFSPFAALTGYEQAVEETARQVEQRLEIDDDRIQKINDALNDLKSRINSLPLAEITYFVQDERKQGGKYLKRTLRICRVDEYGKTITDSEGLKIAFSDIYDIESCPEDPARD